jgi:hypothetical protein
MEFVINLTTEDMAFATDWCGVRSGKDYNKFEEMHLTPGKAKAVSAPIIEESPLCIECRVKEIVSLGSHDMFIADIVTVSVDEGLLDEKGKLCLERAKLAAFAHGEYYEVEYSDMECADSYHADRELTSKENVKVIKGAFDSLGDVTGKALWLQTMGYETKEIEDNLGKAGGALRTAMSRGRSQLRSNEDILRVAEEVFGYIGNKAA